MSSPPTITAEELELSLAAGASVVVQLTTPWCTQCPTQSSVVERLVRDGVDIAFAVADLSVNPELAARYDLATVPAFLLFDRGRHRGTLRGFQRANQLLAAIDQLSTPRGEPA